MREIMIIAGEASGDLHGGALAEQLRALAPDRPLVGIGGGRMEAAGVELLERVDNLAVMGFVEVLAHIPKHWALLRTLRARMDGGRVGLLVLIDYPGFNLKLATAAHEAGVPVLYFITPQVWAWGAGRLSKMAEVVTRAAPILPFEEKLLRDHGIDAQFVGHPLLDRAQSLPSSEEARRQLGLDAARPVLALFPGSRAQEIARHLDDFVATGEEMRRRVPDLQIVVSVAATIDIDPGRCPFPMVRGASFPVLRAADAAMCKSGTTTLEAAVAGCPLVVAYRTSGWTYRIARHLVKIPHIGLVNVVAGREVAREFVQDALVPSAVSDELERLLSRQSPRRAEVVNGLAEVRAKLGTPGAAARVARMALEMVR
ncbi:MAG TPA: lipid-A-disaccharide synthase [Gemmatimonadaceae bacterium]|nr:lipid-A-disaccharide synthase [Gemmatimonadaceae bacterium]